MTIIVKTTASASARDYEWLKKSVADWLHRTDLDGVIADCVIFAEQRINSELRKRWVAEVPALADNGGSNWLIEQHAGLYLAATMCAALLYTGDMPKLQMWEAKYADAVGVLDFDPSISADLVVRPDRKAKE